MPTSMLEDKSRFDLNYYDESKTANAFHSHYEYEVYYFHKGSCTYLIGDKIYTLSPGDVILMNGLTLHRPRVFEKEEYVRSTIHFDPEFFKNMLNGMSMECLLQPFMNLQSCRLHLNAEQKEEFEAALKRMDEFNNKETEIAMYRFQLAFVELLTILYAFTKEAVENQHKEADSSDQADHVQQVISFIESHYMEVLSLETFEKELHFSKYYLSKIFKKVTGFTVFHYVYQRRINQAKIDFLLNPSSRVTDVSFNVGFKHPAHFSRVFKKLTGVSPEQYKKSFDLS